MKKILFTLFFYLKSKYYIKRKSGIALKKWQDKKAKNLIKKIMKKSSYYNDLFRGRNIDDWRNFPITTKGEFMENFTKLNTVGITKEDAFNIALKSEQNRDFSPKINGVTVGLSSGTSGNRGIFLVSDKERFFWAGNILSKILPNSIFAKNKIAFFLRANSNLYESVKGRNIQFEFFDLLTPLDENINNLNQFNPTMLIAPPSLLKLLAQNYDKIDIRPKKIISVAEVLDEIDKIYLEKTFNQPIFQVYQATEGFIATTCKYGHFHINEDLLVVQKDYIDKANGKFIPIITDLNRVTQPVIRYKLNDILTEYKGECPCGCKYLTIEKIEGRCDDIFQFKSILNDKLVPIFPDYISRAIIFSSDKITDYKVIQSSQNEILVYVNTDDGVIKDKILDNFSILFDKYKCVYPKIYFIGSYTHTRGKKFKRIEVCFNTSDKNNILDPDNSSCIFNP